MGYKQRRVYRLDENRNRIMGEDGKALFDAVPTTDWGSPETLEHWREVWAAMVNAKFEEKGLECRIDHRSYERQRLGVVANSISLASPQAAKLAHSATPPFPAEPALLGFGWVPILPTVHEDVAIRQMEAKGITTDKGDFNRWVKAARKMLGDLRKKIAGLTDWIKAVKDELSKSQAPTLADFLNAYYAARNAVAWSRNARIGNLKSFAEVVNNLTENDLLTLEDLETRLTLRNEQTEAVNDSLKAMSARKKEIEDLLHLVDLYRETKPIYDKWKAIKWKGQREKFELEHERDLKVFHMTRRKLEKPRSPEDKIPVQAWRQELTEIQRNYPAEYERYKLLRDDLKKLRQVKSCVDTALRQQEQTRQKRREAEQDR